MPRTIIRRLALTGATGGVLVLTGCSAVDTNGPSSVVQPTPLSDAVTVSQPFCAATGSTATVLRAAPAEDPGCGSYSGYSDGLGTRFFTTGGGGRLLVAVQVADGTADPTLTLRRRPEVAFTEDPAVLAKVPAAPDGRHWVGYRSGEVRFAKDEPNAGDVVDATVAISRGADRPASDELVTTIAIGDQVTGNGNGAEYPADRTVVCDEDLSSTPDHDSNISTTTCPGQTASGPFGNSAPSASRSSIAPTDAEISTPDAETAVQPGRTATVPFLVERAGDAPDGATLALSASTSVPGGQADASTSSLPWEAPATEEPPTTTDETPTTTDETPTPVDEVPVTGGDPLARPVAPRASAPLASEVTVAVAVPASTPPGVYDVVLKAADAGGSRTATARIRVPAATPVPTTSAPPSPVAPAPAPATPRKPISTTVKLLRSTQVSRRTRRLHLGRVTCVRDTGSCTVDTKVRIGKRTIGSATVEVRAKSSAGVTLRLSRADMARLIARSAVATTTITADGSDPVVRTTKVAARRAAKRP